MLTDTYQWPFYSTCNDTCLILSSSCNGCQKSQFLVLYTSSTSISRVEVKKIQLELEAQIEHHEFNTDKKHTTTVSLVLIVK